MPVTRKKKKSVETDDKIIELFEFHGVVFNGSEGDQRIGKCPFCRKPKLFVNSETGQFDCKTCGVEGNKYTFLEKIHAHWLKKTKVADRKRLSKLRGGIPSIAYKDVAYRKDDNTFLIPERNVNESMVNIGTWNKKGQPIYRTPGCKTHLGGISKLKAHGPIYFVEGQWDEYALRYLLSKQGETASVVSASSNTFKEEWLVHFRNRDVVIICDNDEAGDNGIKKRTDALSKIPLKSLKYLRWPDSYPDKYDLNDLIADHTDDFDECFHLLQKLIKPVKSTNGSKSKEIYTDLNFRKVLERYETCIYMTQSMKDALALNIAVVLSGKDEGEPLWLFLVGPPGCLTGDSNVMINRGGKSFNIKLENLYHKFHGGSSNGGFGERRWNSGIPTKIQSRSEEDGCIRSIIVNDVVYSGVKQVYRLTLSDGRKIKATADHRFFTDRGWKKLSQLTVKDSIYADIGQKKGERSKKNNYPEKEGLRNHPYANRKEPTTNAPNGRYCVAVHRLVIEAGMNKMFLEEYIRILREDPKRSAKLKFLDPSLHVHHKDENTMNFDADNLEVCTREDHFKNKHDFSKHVLYQTGLVKIQSIKKIGRQPTYDVCCEDPHNFIANGMVVHNSGKTLLLQNLSDSDYTHYESSLGPKTLVSGWKTADGEDPSLLPQIISKCLIVKDWTEIMAMPTSIQEEIYGVFRGVYDGRYERSFGNGIPPRIYPDPNGPHKTCRFSLIAGVTNKIFGDNRANMGERFIKFKLENDNVAARVKQAIANAKIDKSAEFESRDITRAFIESLYDHTDLVDVPSKIENQIAALAEITSNIRVQVERRQNQVLYPPEPEIATRLAKQTIRVARYLALVLGRKTIDDKVFSIVQKIAMDTCFSWHQKVFLEAARYAKGATRGDIAHKVKMAPSTADRCLFDLLEVGAVRRKQIGAKAFRDNKPGREAFNWYLSPEMKEAYRISRLHNFNGV